MLTLRNYAGARNLPAPGPWKRPPPPGTGQAAARRFPPSPAIRRGGFRVRAGSGSGSGEVAHRRRAGAMAAEGGLARLACGVAPRMLRDEQASPCEPGQGRRVARPLPPRQRTRSGAPGLFGQGEASEPDPLRSGPPRPGALRGSGKALIRQFREPDPGQHRRAPFTARSRPWSSKSRWRQGHTLRICRYHPAKRGGQRGGDRGGTGAAQDRVKAVALPASHRPKGGSTWA